jgi:translocation and assembly module TamA
MTSSLRLEQRLQSVSGVIRLPTTEDGYRDSANASTTRTEIEGQTTTLTQTGVKRAWGTLKREQYVGANVLSEQVKLDGAESSDNYAATLGYGITLRRTDNNLNPSRGYLFNAQFNGAPLASLSNGTFLQSYFKTQAYYPITKSTQLIARAELGMVHGKNSAPATFLFRAGGDQSVRGYGFQSLGVNEGDAIVGGRYLATGSIEIIQWITPEWGAAIFTDFGNAANTVKDLKPVYGYGLGARWKSPVGPIGADIAYGQETDEYRMHFNIGVIF